MKGDASAKRRLIKLLLIFFAALSLPLAALLVFSFGKLTSESFLQLRFTAEQSAAALHELATSILNEEEARPLDHYSFLVAARSEITSRTTFQRSPLSELKPVTRLSGLIGFFQIAPDGSVTSPALPDDTLQTAWPTTIEPAELVERNNIVIRLREILAMLPDSRGARVGKTDALDAKESTLSARADKSQIRQEALLESAAAPEQQQALEGVYDRRQVEKLKKMDSQPKEEAKVARKESANVISLPPSTAPNEKSSAAEDSIDFEHRRNRADRDAGVEPRVITFEAEIDPLQAVFVPDNYLVLFRKAWRQDGRVIQGAIVNSTVFFESLLNEALSRAAPPPGSATVVSHAGSAIIRVRQLARDLSSPVSRKQSAHERLADYRPSIVEGQQLLYEAAFPSPLNDFQTYFSIEHLPLPAGSHLVMLLSAILVLVLLAGLFMLYRLGAEQITLAQQRSDFVSAVSHELKTPLTSIRMYGEMLKNDWVQDESKRRSYYEYIFQESERLSRLINNVLRYARLTNRGEQLELHLMTPRAVLEILRGKVEQMTAAAGFNLEPVLDAGLDQGSLPLIAVDDDALSQICINLVDNAIKFSQQAERKQVDIGFRLEQNGTRVVFFVRDYGPGVGDAEKRKIFELFYRTENELTRKTSGTGIGLALVKALAAGMSATIDYRTREPGAEFQVRFPT